MIPDIDSVRNISKKIGEDRPKTEVSFDEIKEVTAIRFYKMLQLVINWKLAFGRYGKAELFYRRVVNFISRRFKKTYLEEDYLKIMDIIVDMIEADYKRSQYKVDVTKYTQRFGELKTDKWIRYIIEVKF